MGPWRSPIGASARHFGPREGSEIHPTTTASKRETGVDPLLQCPCLGLSTFGDLVPGAGVVSGRVWILCTHSRTNASNSCPSASCRGMFNELNAPFCCSLLHAVASREQLALSIGLLPPSNHYLLYVGPRLHPARF